MRDPFMEIPPLPPGYAWRGDRRLVYRNDINTEVFPWLPAGHVLYVEVSESARGVTRVALNHYSPDTGWDTTFKHP